MYDHKCQICSIKLESPSGPIAVGAHIKRLGQPDHGPDVLENILCLCPNHHAQFDSFSYYIEPNTLEVKGLEGFEGKTIVRRRKHEIKREFLEHQKHKYIDSN